MASCLGLYIQDNLIKYAKVTKDRETLKVEAFGMKFYDNMNEAINQIVSETFSYKTPICTNLSDEEYNYFYLFSLLSKNDLKKSIDTEFDSFCYEKGINKNALESRYALVPDMEDKQKIKVIHISTNKVDINKKMQDLEGKSISTITALPMCIANIAEAKEKENVMIVNIEDKTTVTTIVDQKIYNVDKIEEGTFGILNSINQKENSYAKAYEICKNTTIYTMEGKELAQEDENMYLEDIMPSLYSIVQEVRNIAEASPNKITRICLTGIGCMINNIDLYFQEYFPEAKCEILRPYFIPETVKINMKDYIEVNSAIALGLQGLGYGIKALNFKKPSLNDKLPDWLKLDFGAKKEDEEDKKDKKDGKDKKKKFNLGNKFNFSLDLDLKAELDNTEKWLLRVMSGVLAFIIIYSGISVFLKAETDKKIAEVEEVKTDTQKQISLANDDVLVLNTKTSEYEQILNNLEQNKSEYNENRKIKDSIPNFLTSLMFGMPQGVTITSITNTSGYTIRIEAEAAEYSQLGYLIGNIKTTNILYDVTSSAGVKQNDTIKIVIEGKLFN